MNNMTQNPLVFGLIVLIIVCLLRGKVPYIGHLPGDFEFYGSNFHFYFPLASALLVSFLLSILLRLFRH